MIKMKFDWNLFENMVKCLSNINNIIIQVFIIHINILYYNKSKYSEHFWLVSLKIWTKIT